MGTSASDKGGKTEHNLRKLKVGLGGTADTVKTLTKASRLCTVTNECRSDNPYLYLGRRLNNDLEFREHEEDNI